MCPFYLIMFCYICNSSNDYLMFSFLLFILDTPALPYSHFSDFYEYLHILAE